MQLLFWNLGNRPLIDPLADLVMDLRADVVVLAEFTESPSTITATLSDRANRRFFEPPYGLRSQRIQVFHSLPYAAVQPVYGGAHEAIMRVVPPLGREFLLVGVHLPSLLHRTDDDQQAKCEDLSELIRRCEEDAGHRRTVAVGDFNVDPFHRGIVSAKGMHAVSSRAVAARQQRTVDGKTYPFFYNPAWSHLGDRSPSPPGTFFYRSSHHVAYFWHSFDQVLVRPELLPVFSDESVSVLTKAGARQLLDTEGRPDGASGSDHLPICFELDVERTTTDAI